MHCKGTCIQVKRRVTQVEVCRRYPLRTCIHPRDNGARWWLRGNIFEEDRRRDDQLGEEMTEGKFQKTGPWCQVGHRRDHPQSLPDLRRSKTTRRSLRSVTLWLASLLHYVYCTGPPRGFYQAGTGWERGRAGPAGSWQHDDEETSAIIRAPAATSAQTADRFLHLNRGRGFTPARFFKEEEAIKGQPPRGLRAHKLFWLTAAADSATQGND